MTERATAASFPPGGQRGIVYAVTSRKGDVDDAALFALNRLREHAQFIAVVAGPLTSSAYDKLAPLADEVIRINENTSGLWAHREAVSQLGPRLDRFDELILTGDGWFGPVGSFTPAFERMERRSLDVWSMTDRRDPRSRDRTEGRDGALSLNPTWLAIRRRTLASKAWRDFWAQLPQRRPAVIWKARLAEARFSHHMVRAGFRIGSAFPSDDYPAEHADMFNVDLLLRDGCPIVLREVFDGYPLFFDQHAIVGRRVAAAMREGGYPIHLLWGNLARTVAPKALHTNAGMLEVLPETGSIPSTPRFRVLAIVHVTQREGLKDTFERLRWVPGLQRIVATVAGPAEGDDVRAVWRGEHASGAVDLEIRETPGLNVLDTSAALAKCGDLTSSGAFDLIVAVHTGVPGGLVRNAQRYFRRQQLECLLAGPDYIEHVLNLFEMEPGLGLVFPPTPHIGMSTLGDGWLGQRAIAEAILRELGIEVPVDWASPHAPIGGMWIGRPEALTLMTRVNDEKRGLSSDMRTRLLAYAAGELGYHTRTVATAEHASLSHNSLEYTTDHMSMTLYGYPAGYTSILHRAGPVGTGRGRDFLRMYLRYRHPRTWAALARAGRWARRLLRPVASLSGRHGRRG